MKRLLLAILVAGCAKNAAPQAAPVPSPQKHGAEHKDEEEHEELPRQVSLPDAVVREAGIKSQRVGVESLPLTVALTGEVTADPDRSAKMTARVAGRLVDVRFKEGQRVKKGALLAILESTELARARAASTAAEAKARTARLNAERLSSVAKKGLASGQEVAAAEAEATSLEAEARAAKQTLAAFGPSAGVAARLELLAPISGAILSRDGVIGQVIDAEHVVAAIADLDKAYFTARLFEKDLARVRVGSMAEVRLNSFPRDVFQGPVETIGKQLDPTARTVVARIALKNKDDLLKIGLFGKALVVVTDSDARVPRVVVPLSAVTQIADADSVFVRQPDGHFEVHRVTLGRSAAGKVEVLSGLRAGEDVVVDGVFTLKSAVLKSSFGEDEH